MAKKSNEKEEIKKTQDEEVVDTKDSEETSDVPSEEEQEVSDSKDEKEDDSDPKDAMIAELKDKLLRNQAEFENFRKRNEKEKIEMFGGGAVSVLEKILPVVDNFERGLESADDSPFAEGIKMIYKQLMTSLEEMGVTEIKALGEIFDPNLHNAVMHEDNDEAKEGEITQVLQTGYMYKDHVLRHSMVKVAN